jgi:hypothetical protein
MLAATASSASSTNAIVGLIIIVVFLAVLAALTAVFVRTRVRLARAEAELSFLRAGSLASSAPGGDGPGSAPPAAPGGVPLPPPERT